jgi:hypothetical protein
MAEQDRDVTALTMEDRRQAELDAGRARFEELSGNLDGAQKRQMLKRGEDEHRESEEHRQSIYGAQKEAVSKAERDRAGAEVQDQSQTELEAVLHLADRNEPIIDMRRQTVIERLEDDADAGAAQELTTDHVTAQAVNQPTVLANERGQETEKQPLNTTLGVAGQGIPDEHLANDQIEMPTARETPKTRAAAVKVAKGKVPPTQKVVRHGATTNDPDPKTVDKGAVPVMRSASNDILSDASDDDDQD